VSRRLALTALVVRGYDEAIDFYVTKAGFELIEDNDLGHGKRWVVVRPPGSEAGVLLAKASGPRQSARIGDQTGGRVMLFLETPEFDADHARMSAAGVRFLEEPRIESYGVVAVWEDLYGNKWDLLQRA
jgi:catechol 2,3-dioxygenase-like lactoylglutathione lyase family enzyme